MDSSIWMTIGMIAVIIVVFYFFGMRPQKKQEQAAQQMRNNLAVGDEITTIGGIIGKVVSIKEETMVIETTRDHTRIRLLKTAVRSVDVPANIKIEAPAEEKKDEAEDKKEDSKEK
ncbi:MAG: preprotein translocase subunit YajC [Clostridia bacterium]|nr:preprotein translocase subunit YajC [Clostridia bacterium]